MIRRTIEFFFAASEQSHGLTRWHSSSWTLGHVNSENRHGWPTSMGWLRCGWTLNMVRSSHLQRPGLTAQGMLDLQHRLREIPIR